MFQERKTADTRRIPMSEEYLFYFMKLPLYNVASNMSAQHLKNLRPIQVKTAVHTNIYWDILFVHPNKDKINTTDFAPVRKKACKPAPLQNFSRKADTYYLCVI